MESSCFLWQIEAPVPEYLNSRDSQDCGAFWKIAKTLTKIREGWGSKKCGTSNVAPRKYWQFFYVSLFCLGEMFGAEWKIVHTSSECIDIFWLFFFIDFFCKHVKQLWKRGKESEFATPRSRFIDASVRSPIQQYHEARRKAKPARQSDHRERWNKKGKVRSGK